MFHVSQRPMKKHSHQEILQKLAHADELVRAGKSQVEICDVLGVSVMTFHRWRKFRLSQSEKHTAADIGVGPLLLTTPLTMGDMQRVLEELTLENRRLRKIVADLMLEKARIEEQAALARADLEHQSH